jgi:S-DNA-T family DNA segregation ATPase FtsK/SpoIIIE
MMRRSGRDGQVPPWQTVHGQPVDTGHDDARHDDAGHDDARRDGPRGGELVPRPSRVPARHRTRRPVAPPPLAARRVVVAVVTVVGRAASHEPTLNTARWLVRNGVLYIATGAWVVARRWWEARTNARYERLMRAAEAAGDYERLTDWEARAEQARERRHRRRMDWITAPLDLARATAVAILAVIAFLLGLGGVLAIAHADPAWLLAPVQKTVDGVAWLVWLLSAIWLPATVALPWLLLAGLWQLGRRHGSVPRWAAPGGSREHPTVIVTPGGVATALAHLGIPAMNRAVKVGWQVEFATPPVRVNGRGYQTTFSLPMGVTPEMIADKRDVLARNLVRAPLEVWPTAAERAGYVDLWVADQGSTERPAPPYPLLHEGTCDVFAGVPLGMSQRGEVISPALPGGNVAFGGVMGQGKSNAARVVMAGAALDPLAELWVFVFANNGDFDAYQPRLARYHRGVDDTTLAAAVESLQALYAEVGRREARLAQLGAKKVTRPLAEKHPDLRPVVALFSECHELFGHPHHGREAADLAVQTMRRARKTAITLAFDTQSSRADAIPPKIVELVKLNACFAVKSWRSNDGFLGDGSFQAGIRATELRMGKDVGTSILTGATAERFEIVKWFYIEADDDTGYDAATDIITRAMANLHPAVAAPAGAGQEEPAPVVRDLLDDIATVLGAGRWDAEKVPAADIPARLRSLAPDWAPYRTINGLQIRQYLDTEHGVKVATTGRKYPVDPAAIRDAITRRDTTRDPASDPAGDPTCGPGGRS